jgi:hypothetical protein
MAYSGQKTVTTAGTAEALGTQIIQGPLMVKALENNTGLVYVGNDGTGDVSSSTGMPLSAGDSIVFDWVGALGSLLVDAAVNGEGVAWLMLSV